MRIVFIGICASLLLAGCSKESGSSAPVVPGAPAPLGVEVAVASPTRSIVTGTSFVHGTRIGIILQDAGATNVYKGISMPYEFLKTTDSDPGSWISTATPGLMISDLANVFALHPAVLDASEATLSADKATLTLALPATRDLGDMNGVPAAFTSFQLAIDSSKPTDFKEIFICNDEVDYLTGQGTQVSTVTDDAKKTTITMKHTQAMVVVYVSRAMGFTDTPDVKSITIRNIASGAAPLKQGAFSLANNAFTPNAVDAVYTRTMSGFPIDLVRYAMLVLPATIAANGAELELVAGTVKYTLPLPAKTWESGKVYLYNVTISANAAQLGAVELEQWPEWIDKPFDLE